MSTAVSDEMKKQVLRICCDYLHGRWRTINPSEINVQHISGGLSNVLYHCELPKSVSPSREPSEVLVRFYGQVHGEEKLESLLAESVIFTLLSERRLGPRLHGVFPGGRIEEYIQARPLTSKELADPTLSRQIAVRMAKMHSLNVPVIKDPTWIWNSLERWQRSSEDFLKNSTKPVCPNLRYQLQQVNYGQEISFLKSVQEKFPSPVVFAHNDMQEGNILFNENAKNVADRVSLIDFEYCSYNYRGFDIANHFCERMYSYKNPDPPYFNVHTEDYPSDEQMLIFIRSYLRTQDFESRGRGSESSIPSFDETSQAPPHPMEQIIMQEVKDYTVFSHLMWALWSIVQCHISTINFGYMEYAVVRLEHYLEEKRALENRMQKL